LWNCSAYRLRELCRWNLPLTNLFGRFPHGQTRANHVPHRQNQLNAPPQPAFFLEPPAAVLAPSSSKDVVYQPCEATYLCAPRNPPPPIMAWQPDEEPLRQLVQCLKDSLTGQNPSVQKNAEIVSFLCLLTRHVDCADYGGCIDAQNCENFARH
jgi:hypothetical protein